MKIFLDTETTGLAAYGWDKILELAIVDGRGHKLFYERIKPDRRKVWKDAQKIHGISYNDVKGCKPIRFYLGQLQDIFNSADTITGLWQIPLPLSIVIKKSSRPVWI